VHDWKSCVPQGTEGSNPSLSASFKLAVSGSWRNAKRSERWRETPSAVFPVLFDTIKDFADRSDSRVPRNGRPPIPSGPGGSSGNGLSRVPRGRLAVTCVGNAFFARRPYRRVYGVPEVFMSYLVLARKYRPMTFEDLVGQQHVCQTLGNAIKTGRIHHAFLFTGARGVGKTSAARIFAKALNCEAGLSAQPCNRCQSCLEITAGQGLDVFEIDGASNTGVDDIRDLRDNIRYLPSRSRFKIFIIDEVHMLSINAFNALLKTLEEPPEHAKFIFATTEPHKIPVTILSRCQRFDFRKIALPLIRERLQQIAAAEHIVISERSLTLVARRGEGSMRDALSTFDQVIAFCGEDIRDEDVQGLLGMVDRRLLLDTVEGVLGRDGRRVLDAVQRIDDLGYSFRQFCRELVEVFRSLVILGVVDEPAELLDATDEELAALRQLANLAGLEDLQRAVTVLVRTEGDLAGSSFPRLALEMALVRLAHLPPGREVAALVRQFEDLEHRLMAKGLGNIMKQAQLMQQKMERMQQELAEREVEASAGGGMVTAVANGRQQLVSLRIERSVVDPEDVEMLQDLVLAAVNEALRKSQDMMQQEMAKITGGLNIPGLM
jgi:DNA polymerase III subunit gamma/tau/DNA-binding YbaB/EbfC family protein